MKIMSKEQFNIKLQEYVKKHVESYLEKKKSLPNNFHGVEVDVYESHYGKMCHIYFLFKEPYNSFEFNVIRQFEVVLRKIVRDLFQGVFSGGVYSSIETLERFKPRRIFNDDDETPILEYERKPHHKKYEEEYEKIKNNFINYFKRLIDAYSENENQISLYDKSEKRLLTFQKRSKELYYNRDLNEFMMDNVPAYLWMRHGDYIMAEVFNEFFEDEIKYVTPAGMV